MNSNNPSLITFLSSILITFLLPTLTSSQTCQNTCGELPIKYPFGTGPGCGDPRFQPYITCTQLPQQQLTLSTHTGCYIITSIDYNNQVVHISDPTMSTCSCTRPSPGFGLNWDAPFSFHDTTVFALLNCSTPGNYSSTTSSFPMMMCDSRGGTDICGGLLYSYCEAVSRLSLSLLPGASACCVYTPVDLGPSFEMDLEKLGCTSYSAVCEYINGEETNPAGWEYGIALKYKFNYRNDYPALCSSCEQTNGVCGYEYPYTSFACNCPGGFNTTMDCVFGQPWISFGSRFSPWKIGALSVSSLTWFIILAFM